MAEELFKCPHCDYVAKKQGYLTQHIAQKHKEVGHDSGTNKGQKNTQKNEKHAVAKCPDCGGTEFRSLRSKGEVWERLAISQGYTKICLNCEEVI